MVMYRGAGVPSRLGNRTRRRRTPIGGLLALWHRSHIARAAIWLAAGRGFMGQRRP
jgi:hypothetical protein